MTRRRRVTWWAVAVVAVCVGAAQAAAPSKLLDIRSLHGSVVRVGSLHGSPLYGVELRAVVCARSAGEADRTVPVSFRIAHYVISGRVAHTWGDPFRGADDQLHWLVTLGENTTGACETVHFEDVIPPGDYGGLESPLGAMGFSRMYRCYGVQLTLHAVVAKVGSKPSTRTSATGRTVLQCGKFRPG